MKVESHGLSIGMERTGSQFFLTLKARGKLTHDDYKVITPMLDSALGQVTDPRVRVLFDGTELEGWEARAAWDDLKLGLKHGNEFEKIAIYGDKEWLKFAAKVAGWFTSGTVEFFEDLDSALQWVHVP